MVFSFFAKNAMCWGCYDRGFSCIHFIVWSVCVIGLGVFGVNYLVVLCKMQAAQKDLVLGSQPGHKSTGSTQDLRDSI